jgi:hypothetical protein
MRRWALERGQMKVFGDEKKSWPKPGPGSGNVTKVWTSPKKVANFSY